MDGRFWNPIEVKGAGPGVHAGRAAIPDGSHKQNQ